MQGEAAAAVRSAYCVMLCPGRVRGGVNEATERDILGGSAGTGRKEKLRPRRQKLSTMRKCSVSLAIRISN